MTNYRDFWKEFNLIQETAKKKLLKKPNYNDTINQFRQLSVEMEDAEMPEHAAICHREISILYEKINNIPAERQHLIKAAHLFLSARLLRFKMHTSIMQESEALMEECYTKIIEKDVKQDFVKLAALTCTEVADCFLKLNNYLRAYHYLLKGSRYIQNDIFIQSCIIQKMCLIAMEQPCFEEVTTDLQMIWSSLMKELPFVGAVREMLLKIECYIILLNLKHFLTTKDMQRSILLQYSDAVQWQKELKLSVMTKEEFTNISKFIAYVQCGDYFGASKILAFHLTKYLSADAQKLAAEIVDTIDNEPIVDRGFEEICNSTEECSTLEKRQKIFELYNGLIRKNQIKLEFL